MKAHLGFMINATGKETLCFHVSVLKGMLPWAGGCLVWESITGKG